MQLNKDERKPYIQPTVEIEPLETPIFILSASGGDEPEPDEPVTVEEMMLFDSYGGSEQL